MWLYYGFVVDGSVVAEDVAQVARREQKDRERVRGFGRRVRELREPRGWSQERLAQAADVHRAEIGFVERGEREVGIALAWRLADSLAVPLDELVLGLT